MINQNNVPFALTLEREWANNEANISCIPEGGYICKRITSPRFGSTFEITRVDGRTHILFHKGNLRRHSKGCILIGEKFGFLGDKPAILESRHGFNEFMDILKDENEFRLNISKSFR